MKQTTIFNSFFILSLIFITTVMMINTLETTNADSKTFGSYKRATKTQPLNRKLYGFGSNANGQLSQKDYTLPSFMNFFQGKTVSKFCVVQSDGASAGSSFVRVFAVVQGGGTSGGDALYGFGMSGGVSYLLGLNSTTSYSTPQLIGSYSTSIRSLSCGDEHTLFVLNNTARDVYGFGNSKF